VENLNRLLGGGTPANKAAPVIRLFFFFPLVYAPSVQATSGAILLGEKKNTGKPKVLVPRVFFFSGGCRGAVFIAGSLLATSG
jgi:hypothetical protein